MLQTGEYTTYKEFGLDLIKCLELSGYSDALQNDNFPKSRTLLTPQEIELFFYGYKANDEETTRRLGRFSYDCLVRYKGEDVTFVTICRDIIKKCYNNSLSICETTIKM